MGTDLFDLTGKVALITGATQGIGFALARGLAQAGARVVINARNAEKLQGAVAKLTQEGLTVSGSLFDLTNADQIRTKVREIESEFGHIDILVNNAGIQRRMPLENFDEAVWQEVLNTNLTAVFLVAKQVV
jgi:gluconate 5-dehydrogenase